MILLAGFNITGIMKQNATQFLVNCYTCLEMCSSFMPLTNTQCAILYWKPSPGNHVVQGFCHALKMSFVESCLF